ncbi:hypothetical protein [Nitrosopumilus sp.]|uniref:hypothetical protein n=1 Tax=Nitrosopumilus sp. TaxID=2024843 RepID=UPI00262B2EB3|nr:hypothetical protein [Nitrosopumilus sp.]
MNHWEVDLKDEHPFHTDFENLVDDSQEYVKDSIREIVKYKNLSDYEYTVSCPSIPVGIALLRFPNGCEVIIEIEHNKLYYLRAYDDIDEALNS